MVVGFVAVETAFFGSQQSAPNVIMFAAGR